MLDIRPCGGCAFGMPDLMPHHSVLRFYVFTKTFPDAFLANALTTSIASCCCRQQPRCVALAVEVAGYCLPGDPTLTSCTPWFSHVASTLPPVCTLLLGGCAIGKQAVTHACWATLPIMSLCAPPFSRQTSMLPLWMIQ